MASTVHIRQELGDLFEASGQPRRPRRFRLLLLPLTLQSRDLPSEPSLFLREELRPDPVCVVKLQELPPSLLERLDAPALPAGARSLPKAWSRAKGCLMAA